MNGIAMTVLISQLPAVRLLGRRRRPVARCGPSASRSARAGTNAYALAIGAATLVAIPLLMALSARPGILLAVAAATSRSAGSMAAGRRGAGQAAAGACRRSSCPVITGERPGLVLVGGAAVAMVSFADTSVLSRAATRRGTGKRVDPNQEMVGLGAANPRRDCSRAFPISSSSSHAGGRGGRGAHATHRRRRALAVGALPCRAGSASTCRRARWPPSSSRRRSACSRSPTCAASTASRPWGLAVDRPRAGVVMLGAIPGIGLAILLAPSSSRGPRWRTMPSRANAAIAVSRRCAPSQRRAREPGPAVPLGRAAVLRQRRVVPRKRYSTRQGGRRDQSRCAGWWSLPSR